MENVKLYQESIFESIKHSDENGTEYWEARELMKALRYTEWRNFKKVIEKAMITCNISHNIVKEHFVGINKTIPMPNDATKIIEDYKLSRYACYLIVQNGDSRKHEIALGQTYFAVQTRRMEITEEQYRNLSEEEKRIINRMSVRHKNLYLFDTAQKSGVKDFGKFNNYGYKGLYNGETAEDIAKRKGLDENEEILDWMGSTELATNIFRIAQTDEKLKNDKINNENDACDTHYIVGKTIRETIKKLGGTMPEDLPTPEKSIQELEMDELLKIKGGNHISEKNYSLFHSIILKKFTKI